jgi:hypothetical protein
MMPASQFVSAGRGRSPAGRARWRSSSIDLAVEVTARALADRGLPVSDATGVVFGLTVPQPGSSTVAPPWPPASALPAPPRDAVPGLRDLGRLLGGGGAAGRRRAGRTVAGDHHRPHCNGPVLTWPAPSAPGGAPRQEHWVLDSFRRDPWGGLAMVALEWHGQAARTDAQRTNRTGNSLANGGSQLSVCDRLGTGPCLTCRFGWSPRRNRTGDPIFTMDRRPSAVLGRVFAARMTP